MRTSHDPPADPRKAALLLLFFVGLMVRTWRAVQIPVVNPDAVRFIEQAQRMRVDLLGALRSEAYHPLHAFATLLVHSVIAFHFPNDREAWLIALQVVGVFCGSIVAVQIVWLARAFGAPFWASMAAAAAWIVGRRTSVYGADGVSDMLFLTLFAAALLTAIAALRFRTPELTRRQTWQFSLAGFLSGVAYLTRPEGMGVLLIVGITLALSHISSRRRSSGRCVTTGFKFLPRRVLPLKPLVQAMACMAISAALPSVPYMLAIGAFTHKKTIDIVTATLHTAPVAAAFLATGTPLDKLMKLLMELMETFGFGPGIALLGAMLLAPRFWGRPRLRPLVVTWIAVWILLMAWLMNKAGYLDGRHTLGLELVLYGLLALAFVAWMKPMRWWMAYWRRKPVWNRLPAWLRWAHWPHAFAGCAVFLALLPGLILLREPPQQELAFVRTAAAWLHGNIKPSVPIIGLPRLIGYYSGNPTRAWGGTPEKPALETLHVDTPSLFTYTFRPSKGQTLQFNVGPYQSIALFKSPTGAQGDILMFYAIPGSDVYLKPQDFIIPMPSATAPATASIVR
jgi:hypothetical protein